MKILFYALVIIIAFPVLAKAQDSYVEGYYRNDGTYVQPHYRTAPNNNPYDNWSAQNNVNPYAKNLGTQNPASLNNNGAEDSFKPQTYQNRGSNDRPYGSSYKKPNSGM